MILQKHFSVDELGYGVGLVKAKFPSLNFSVLPHSFNSVVHKNIVLDPNGVFENVCSDDERPGEYGTITADPFAILDSCGSPLKQVLFFGWLKVSKVVNGFHDAGLVISPHRYGLRNWLDYKLNGNSPIGITQYYGGWSSDNNLVPVLFSHIHMPSPEVDFTIQGGDDVVRPWNTDTNYANGAADMPSFSSVFSFQGWKFEV